MENEKISITIFAIAAVILAMSTLNVFNQQEKFTEVTNYQNVIPKYASGPSLSAATNLENYQDSVIMNVGTSTEDVNKTGAQYYINLQNYLNPSLDNLELAQNISSRPIMAGVPLPGASSFYKNGLGDGYADNLGQLGGNTFPAVSYTNDRAAQLSKCAKDLPMFAASSLLPKPSVNADNNALSQSAARALAAFTALSPAEQIGSITSNNTPYSKTSDYRALDQINYNNFQTPMFGSTSAGGIPPAFGQVQSNLDRSGPSGFTNN